MKRKGISPATSNVVIQNFTLKENLYNLNVHSLLRDGVIILFLEFCWSQILVSNQNIPN